MSMPMGSFDRRGRGGRRGGLAALATGLGHGLGLWVAPLVDVWARCAVAAVFFRSGLQKIDDWPSTVYLFVEEYRLPLLPPELSALLATATELSMPVLLVLGLFTRLAALPLLGMTLVIQFVLGAANPAFDHPQHFFWMILLCGLIARGPGALSLDHMIVGPVLFGRTMGRRP